MKFKFIIIVMLTAAVTFSQCSDAAFNEKYADPSKVAGAAVDKMMTGVFMSGLDFVKNSYWRFFAYDNQNIGSIAQTWGMYTGPELYEGGYPAYIDEAWPRFQKVLVQFKMLESMYNGLEDAKKTSFKPYYYAAKVFTYQCMLQTLDAFGDIPFSEVGQLGITGNVVYPKRDDDKVLYELILDELGTIVNEFASGNMSIASSSDFFNDGDMDKWTKYANSIRLRAAIRVSSQGDLKTKGETVIKEILGTSGKPVVTGADDMIKLKRRGEGEFNWDRMDGITDWRECRLASKAMMDRLQDDPRKELLYDAIQAGPRQGQRVGVDTHDSRAVTTAYIEGSGLEGSPCQYSYVNETSFRENKNIEGYIVTPSEIAFYKAEAIQRTLISGNAKNEFVKAVRESVKLYAKINAESTAPDPTLARSPKVNMSAWTDAAIDAFAATKWDNSSNKLQLIYEQLWLHCGIINSIQSWNTIRRTGYPQLYYPTTTSIICPDVPQRFIVPASEWSVNPNIDREEYPAAYQEVLFWAKKVE
jgi:hypothetical protein